MILSQRSRPRSQGSSRNHGDITDCIEAIDKQTGKGGLLAVAEAAANKQRSTAVLVFLCGLPGAKDITEKRSTPLVWRLPDGVDGKPRYRSFCCWRPAKVGFGPNPAPLFEVVEVHPRPGLKFANSSWWGDKGQMLQVPSG